VSENPAITLRDGLVKPCLQQSRLSILR